MTPSQVIDALALPVQARVDQRVPKKHLLDHGAPTAADKRAITEGIEEITWVAALKPSTVGVPAFRDPTREYLEVAVLTVTFRPGAKASRLRELVHRAIPYPLVLVAGVEDAVTLSLAHLRHAENEAGKTVLDGGTVCADVADDAPSRSFVNSLSLAGLPKDDLFVLYQSWVDRVNALDAARLTGVFTVCTTREATDARRDALHKIAQLDSRIGALRADAEKEKQLSRRIELNLELRKLKDDRASLVDVLATGEAP